MFYRWSKTRVFAALTHVRDRAPLAIVNPIGTIERWSWDREKSDWRRHDNDHADRFHCGTEEDVVNAVMSAVAFEDMR